jgi:AGZA family xanthine/uracil permease-like MFS transporter
MLWGAFVAKLIDRELKTASFYLLLCAGLTFFGVIHSALPEGNMYLPWLLPDMARRIPYQFTAGYLVLALMMAALSYTKSSREPAPEV